MNPFAELQECRAPTVVFEIYTAGDVNDAKRALTKLASQQGACWSVEPTEYIYSGGRETGVVVRSINYPRFAKNTDQLEQEAVNTAKYLIAELGQGSCSIVGPKDTIWLTRRREDIINS
jgi:hypothetical protein